MKKIELPEKLLFTHHLRVRITDINYGNHLGNDSIIGMLHESRFAWLHSNEHTELNVGNTGMIMSDIEVQFRKESFYGDELTIGIFCGDVSKLKFDLYYRVTTIRNEKNVEIALARTGMVSFDYDKKSVAAMSPQMEQLLR